MSQRSREYPSTTHPHQPMPLSRPPLPPVDETWFAKYITAIKRGDYLEASRIAFEEVDKSIKGDKERAW